MPDGDREAALEAFWLRAVRASVSNTVVRSVQGIALVLALGTLTWIALVPRAERELLVLDVALDFLRNNSPTDVILAQLPPERWASVRARGAAQIGRLLLPALLGGASLLVFAAGALGLIARKVRSALTAVHVAPVASARTSKHAGLFFWSVAFFAVAVHIPYALESIRFDEDHAAIYANNGWFSWANNLSGWFNHVGAMLTIRLSTAVFGMNELSVRAPAILASSLALAFLCTHLRNRFSTWSAVLTAALCLAVPLWAEQTTLARGYGLTFSAAALLAVGLLRLDEEQQQPSTQTMLCLFAGVFIGCLAHVFFAFTAVGLLVLACFSKQFSPAMRVVMVWWLALAAALPGISALVGLPGSLANVSQTGDTEFTAVLQRFAEELKFRHTGIAGNVLLALCLLALLGSLFTLPKRVRTPVLVIGGFALFGPLLGNSIYVYPRFFLHTLAFAAPCVAWFISERALRANNLANAVLVVGLVGLWASTQPWQRLQHVDLRGAAKLARAEAERHREHFAIDTFISPGMRFYNGTPGRIVNSAHAMPSDVDRFLMSVPHRRDKVPEGFVIERRIDGIESDVLLLSKVGAQR